MSMKQRQGGYALVTALIFFLAGGAAVVSAIADSVLREAKTVRNEYTSKQGYLASESSLEDALYRIKNGKALGTTEVLSVGTAHATTTVTTELDGSQTVFSSGDQSGTARSVVASVAQSGGVSFPYALQSGLGGVDMDGSSRVIGDLYTTGSIRGCSSCVVTGMAVAAGKSSSNLDQDNSTPTTPITSINFGNANGTQDLAQSFTVSDTLSLTNLQIYVKKVGSPSNATVRIVTDSNGSPSTSVLASGTLSSSLVSMSYTWQTISLTANPILSAGTTYWIVIDANSSSSKYYVAAGNTGSYASGMAKVGRYGNSWSAASPSGVDAYFKVSIGSTQVGLSGENQYNQLQVGSGYAYTASYINASGILYCQMGVFNNKSCDTSRGDPVIEPDPINGAAINTWKSEAAANTYNGNYSVGGVMNVALGPKKISGDLTITDSGIMRVSGTIWVTGDILIDGASTLRPDDPSKSYVVIADGTISLGGSAQILGGSGSHILLVSTSSADPAVTISGAANDIVVYAGNGGLYVTGSGAVNVAAANHVKLDGAGSIQYDADASTLNLTSGGSQGFDIKSWEEAE
jgi:hypothetical protein